VAELVAVGHVAEMTEGGNGQFDVIADGETIFSKRLTGRFPEPGEVVAALS